MPRRLLTLWITVLLVGGATMVATQAERATPLTTTAGDLPRPRVIDAITVAPSTTAPAPAPATSVPNSAPRRATTTTTTTTTVSAPLAVPLVAKPAVVDGPGAYIVGRDGTGLRRLFDCQAPLFRTWLGPDVLAVTDDGNDQIPRRIWLDGHTSTFPQPLVAITGATGTLRGVGSIAPGGGRTVISFAQAPSHGVAILDLETGTNRVIVSGDNPTPVWSPTGDILLVGPSGTAVIDERGTILRDWAPSSLSMATMGTFGFSSDGRYVVGADSSDINRWVVLEPRSNQARRVPQVGSGWNQVEWAGTRLVLNDPGRDHEVPPAVNVWDPASGMVTRVADGASGGTAPGDGQVVAFGDSTDPRKLGLASIDGTRRSTLVHVADGLWTYPDSWSPDGARLLFDVCPRTQRSGGLPST